MTNTDWLSNKKILFFAPKFFGYGLEIASKLRELGSIVDFFDEKPDNDFLTKALVRVNKKLLLKKIQKYYQSIFYNLEVDYYDFVFFLAPESISVKSLEVLRGLQSRATFILYMWDSLKNRKNVIDMLPYFDFKYSFDKDDCKKKSNHFQFRPLFFLDDYKNVTEYPKNYETDLLFVGTVHSDRYKLLLDIKKECIRLNKKTLYFMFLPSRNIYYLKKILNTNFRNSTIKEFNFKPLSKSDLLKRVNSSVAVLDIQHPSQTGLTMRVIEMLGAKKKIITTNSDIVNYNFYCANNILYIDRDNPKLNLTFFESDYLELDKEIYFEYSLLGWLEEVFSKSKLNGI